MAQYNIKFSSNASAISKQLSQLQADIARVGISRTEIKLGLDTADFTRSINSSFKELDKAIGKAERRLRKLSIGSPEFTMAAERSGGIRGQRERGQMIARAIGSREAAQVFDVGSLARYERALESLQIQASLIAPNTKEWVNLQQSIGAIRGEMQKASKTAESIQLRETLGAFNPGSLNQLKARLTILKTRADDITPNTKAWQQLNKEIQRTESSIKKLSSPLTMRQRAGAAGGAFLYGGGLGGGVGSAVGGIAGGIAGGTPGAFFGAAVGQSVDNMITATSEMTEQATVVKRLQLGLASISTGYDDLSSSIQEVEKISERLLIPIDEVYRKFTQLRVSTASLGIDVKTTGKMFEGVTAAVLMSGGSMDDVNGAMRAVVQVFSKGKLTAEELRGQLGERLPGAVIDFARSSGRSVQELDKAFETGGATLDEFVEFLRGKANDVGGYVDSMADRSEFAGARMQKAFERLRLGVGGALQPTGAAIQDFVTQGINLLDKYIHKLIEVGTILPSADFIAGEALAGRSGGVAGLEQRLLEVTAQEEALRDQAKSVGMGFAADLLPGVRDAAKEGSRLQEALIKVREILKLTKKDQAALPTGDAAGDAQKEAERRAKSLLDATERREEGLARARQQLEERVADIRKRATEEVERIERQYADKRLSVEREIAQIRRDIAFEEQRQALEGGAALRIIGGESPDLIDLEKQILEAKRQFTEEEINRKEQAQDEEIRKARELEDFRTKIAKAINEANLRYAKQVGEVQRAYAQASAKIFADTAETSGKRMLIAGRIASLELRREALNAQRTALGRQAIPLPGGYRQGEPLYPTGQVFEIPPEFQEIDALRKEYVDELGVLGNATPSAGQVSLPAFDSKQFDTEIQNAQRGLAELQKSLLEALATKNLQNFAATFTRFANQQNDRLAGLTQATREQNGELQAQLELRRGGLRKEEADSLARYRAQLNFVDKNLQGLVKQLEGETSIADAEQRAQQIEAQRLKIKKAFVGETALLLAQNRLYNLQLQQMNQAEEKANEQRREAIQLVEQSVSGAMSSYKEFLGAIVKGEGMKDALSRMQQAFRDQAVTLFFDFAMKPMEKMLKEQLTLFFGLETEEALLKRLITEAEKQVTELEALNQNLTGQGAATPASAPSREVFPLQGDPSPAPLGPQTVPSRDPMGVGMGGSNDQVPGWMASVPASQQASSGGRWDDYVRQSMERVRQQMSTMQDPAQAKKFAEEQARVINDSLFGVWQQTQQQIVTGTAFSGDKMRPALDQVHKDYEQSLRLTDQLLAESLGQLGQTVVNGAQQAVQAVPTYNQAIGAPPAIINRSAGAAAAANKTWQQNLGATVQAIGMAAASITSITAGISQIKKGGASNVLTGIGSIMMGGLSGFMSGRVSFTGGAGSGGPVPLPTGADIGTLGPNSGFRQFATGGIVKGPTLGLVGEGRFNEAVVPLPDGKSIPVELGKDGGNQIISNITITVNDGKAQSSSSGGGSSEFGKRMESAVKQVIVNELRPGGVLSGRR